MDTASEMDTLDSRLLELNLDPSTSSQKQARRATIDQARLPSKQATETHTPEGRKVDSNIESVEHRRREDPVIAVEQDQTTKNSNGSPKPAQGSGSNRIVAELQALCEPDSKQEELFRRFGDEIEITVRGALDNREVAKSEWKRVLQACYDDAAQPMGSPNCERLGTSYILENLMDDPDEATHGLEGTLEERAERSRNDLQELWTDFWYDLVNLLPEPRTLFCSSSIFDFPSHDPPKVPTYLFRVYDVKSRGINNESTFASGASQNTQTNDSRDLLSVEGSGPAEELARHLSYDRGRPTNLISWTSSLLCAIQCARWRWGYLGSIPERIFICMVDTRKFSQDQFRSDVWLIARLQKQAEGPTTFEDFFRHKRNRFNNGEYLSQGVMFHEGRSRIMSLKDILDSGLCDLYPAFEGPSSKWALDVRTLRDLWKWPSALTAGDVATALRIAEACFRPSQQLDAVIIILTMRERSSVHVSPSTWTPLEVDRCYAVLEVLYSGNKWLALQQHNALRSDKLIDFLEAQAMMGK
jgi:hypothetical protein